MLIITFCLGVKHTVTSPLWAHRGTDGASPLLY